MEENKESKTISIEVEELESREAPAFYPPNPC